MSGWTPILFAVQSGGRCVSRMLIKCIIFGLIRGFCPRFIPGGVLNIQYTDDIILPDMRIKYRKSEFIPESCIFVWCICIVIFSKTLNGAQAPCSMFLEKSKITLKIIHVHMDVYYVCTNLIYVTHTKRQMGKPKMNFIIPT